MKNLLGFIVNGKKITENTPNEVWKSHFGVYELNLKSLEYCPKIIHGYFNCWNNQLESLKGIHKQLHEMNGVFFAHNNPIKSHVIGVLLVKGCKGIYLDNQKVEKILNKYLPNVLGMRSVLECQEELILAGFDEFAEL